MNCQKLLENPIHLGSGATARVEPRFTGEMDWYTDYAERHAGDMEQGRLVSMHQFSKSWDMWEVHPQGCEVVLCINGMIELHQESPSGESVKVKLNPGDYAINEPGVWHTADIETEATVLFITAGAGTQHRPR